jgi:TonB family protein
MSKTTFVLACVLCATLSARGAAQDSGADAVQTYLSMQVDKEVKLRSGSQPRYPTRLQKTRVAGEVLVQFIVNERGQPQMESFKVLRSSNTEFTESVRSAVRLMSFFPAEVNGKKVKQLVQVPFKFDAGS